MPGMLSRRDLLRLWGATSLSLAHPPFLTGCSGSSSKSGGNLPPLVYDPNVSWWMQHDYGPVSTERDAVNLEVEGAIPPELTGLYVRNGSNPKNGDPGHWFLGNGMVHGVRLESGKAAWYKNRWVRTPLLDRPPPDGGVPSPPTLTDTASNVSVVYHASRLLALGEVGLPYELSPPDLSTLGAYDFAGKLQTFMTAHPKLDPVTSEMLFFGYDFVAPFLTYHRADATGALTKSIPIDLPASVMMHDFQVTETRVLFLDLPIVFDIQMAIGGSPFPFRWDASHPARLGILSRDATAADVQWIPIDPCFIFHTLNAYDDPSGNIVLEAARYPELWRKGPDDFDAFPSLHQYVIDPAAGTAKLTQIDDRLVEFPQLDRRRMGRKYRYGYSLWLADPDGSGHPNGVRGIVKYDRQGETAAVHGLDSALQLDETFFVPASSTSAEDEGWLLGFVYDRRTDRSDLYIADASRMEAPPVARVKLPFRVPFGFHGIWIPG